MLFFIMPLAGLAWDWISLKLYWTDYCDDDIEVYDPISGARKILFDLDLESPYSIVVDPINGCVKINNIQSFLSVYVQSYVAMRMITIIIYYYSWMYWTDTGTDRIEKASLDGSYRTTLHSTGLSNVIGLTLDYENHTLYWIEYTYYGRIERSLVNGSNRETILSNGLYYPWGLSYIDGTLYLTEYYHGRINSVTVTQPVTTNPIASIGSYPYDIEVIAEEKQQIG